LITLNKEDVNSVKERSHPLVRLRGTRNSVSLHLYTAAYRET